MRVKKTSFLVISILIFIAIFSFAYSRDSFSSDVPTLIVFYSPACHKCVQVKSEIIPDIEKEFKAKIKIEYRDISDIGNYRLLLSLQEKYGLNLKNIWPVLYLQGHFLNGQEATKKRIAEFITVSLNIPAREERLGLPLIDLISHFKTFKPLTIISAGLIDGINPCAFTVIVFFISFLTLQGYRKRDLIIIGLVFISAVFLTYLLIGIGFFGFLYRLKTFWRIAKIFNLSIGIFSIILGILALYDFFKFKKRGQTQDLVLQLPAAIKNKIHSVIGLHYRKTKGPQGEFVLRKHTLRLVLSALITGLLVSVLELVCTGQTYLPTLTFILKTTPFKIPALGYLLIYNLMFIAPLLIIFFFALLGVTSQQFSNFLKRHLLTIKILMAILFFVLGIFLIWRA